MPHLQVSLDELRLSLTLRHGKEFLASGKSEDRPEDSDDEPESLIPQRKKKGNKLNKLQMASRLAEDLEFEKFKQIDSSALAQMETDITVLEKNKQTRKAAKIRSAFAEIWSNLEAEQDVWWEQLQSEQEAELDEMAQEKENQFVVRTILGRVVFTVRCDLPSYETTGCPRP